jgi:hypothetical protein
MKIFEDNKCKKLLESVHLGTVEALKEKELVVYVQNDSEAVLENIEFRFPKLAETEKLEIINAPKTMQPGTIESLKIKWKPSLNFKQALNVSLEIIGDEVYYAK